MSRIVVSHDYYGCDTGCCGHVIKIDGEQSGRFHFDHPFGDDLRAWAEGLISSELGPDHVQDLDWENSVVIAD